MKYIMYIAISLSLCSCLDDPEYYHSRFYPVIQADNDWEVNEIFNRRPISIELESRIDFEDYKSGREGIFDPIKFENTILSADKDFYFQGDTIKKGENLLDHDFASIETLTVSRNSEMVDDSYLFWINKEDDSAFYSQNCCYYTIYVSSSTDNDHIINDSTVIKIEQ